MPILFAPFRLCWRVIVRLSRSLTPHHMLAPLVFLMMATSGPTFADPSTAAGGPLTITEAQIAIGAAAGQPDAADWQPVALPHSWAKTGGKRAGRARYRVRVELPPLPDVTWALWIDRMSSHHELRINGRLVHGTLPPLPGTLRRPVPALIAVPSTLLAAGTNEIDILVDQSVRGGLSTLQLGPLSELEPPFTVSQRRQVQWPQGAQRRRWPAMRALVITGNTLPAELVRLERSGVPVLHKPFRTEALLAALSEKAPAPEAGSQHS